MRQVFLAALAASALAACGDAGEFECYSKPRNGVFRECQLAGSPDRLSACETQGCFRQERVFCFQGVGQRVCTPSREECEGWRVDWVSVDRAPKEGVCYETAGEGK